MGVQSNHLYSTSLVEDRDKTWRKKQNAKFKMKEPDKSRPL